METSKAADTTVATVKGTELHTMTPEGRAYVEKKIHPPAPTPSSYQGRPTTSSQEICIFQTTGETDVSPIFKYKDVTRYPDKMLLLSMPGGVVGQYVFYATSDDSFAQQSQINLPPDTKVQPPATLMAGYEWETNYQRDVGSHFLDYKSTTVYANCTGFNNQGLITTAIFKPDIVTSLDGFQDSTLHHYAMSLEPKSRANLARAIGAPVVRNVKHRGRKTADDDEFEVIDDDVPVHDFSAVANYKYQILNWGHQTATTSDLGGQIVINGLFPKDAGEIQVMSRNTATRPFVDGAFVVERDAQEVQTFVPRPVIPLIAQQIPQPLVVCMMTWYNPQTQVTYHYLLNSKSITTGAEQLPFSSDIPWTDMTASITLVQAMTVPGDTQPFTNGLPFMSIKTICGYVVQPAPKSSLRVFMTESPMPDRAALEMIACINRQRPDSLPAKMNDAGTIMSAILSLAPSVIGFLTDAFGKKKTAAPAPAKKKSPKISNKGKTTFSPPNAGTLVTTGQNVYRPKQPNMSKAKNSPGTPKRKGNALNMNQLMGALSQLVAQKPKKKRTVMVNNQKQSLY